MSIFSPGWDGVSTYALHIAQTYKDLRCHTIYTQFKHMYTYRSSVAQAVGGKNKQIGVGVVGILEYPLKR